MTTKQLPRVLRFFDVSVLASASMGPAYSLASTMGPMIVFAGNAAPLALLVLSAIMLCMAIAYAQLSRVAPNAGSSYSWIRMAFGNRVGAYGAWLLLLSNFFATMATAVPAGIYTLALVAPAHAQDPRWSAGVGAIWILGSALLLYLGVRPTAMVTTVALLIELSVLAASALVAEFTWHAPILHAAAHHAVGSSANTGGAMLIPLTFFGFINAMTLGIWMSDGWEISASTSEEMREKGGRSASGRGGIAGLLVTTAILLLCMLGYMHAGTLHGFVRNQADALAYIGDLLSGNPVLGGGWFGGNFWRFAIVITVLLSTSSALWTTILYLSRSVYAMGRDGLLPAKLGELDKRSEPLWSLVTIAILVTICELITGFSPSAAAQLDLVLTASSMFLGLLFAFTGFACARHFSLSRPSWAERCAHIPVVDWRDATRRFVEVVIPLGGSLALLAVLVAAIALASGAEQWYAWGGIALGIPFAIWRGLALRPSTSLRYAQDDKRGVQG